MEGAQGTTMRREQTGRKMPALEVVAARKVNLACLRNSVPVLRELVVANATEECFENLRLRVTSDPPFFAPHEWVIDRLLPESRFHIRDIGVKLSGQYFESLSEAVPGLMKFALEDSAGNPLTTRTESIELLARDEWGGLGELPEMIAAFMQPNSPAVEHVLRAAADRLASIGESNAIDGYQSESPRRVATLVSAIWSAVCMQKIAYVVPPASFEKTGQKIRSPDRILEHRLATCLDLSVFFAACLEQAGLHPLIVFTKGHAFVGCWLQPLDFSHIVEDDFQALRKRVQLKELLVFEPTLATHVPYVSFTHAVKEAERHLEKDEEAELAVDVHRARMARILPLTAPAPPAGEGEAGGVSGDSTGAPPIEIPPDVPEAPREEAGATDEKPKTPDERVARWLRKLLDLSLRNPLLNCRPNRKAVPLICPNPGRLEDLLADGKVFRFEQIPDLEGEGERARSARLHREHSQEDLYNSYVEEALERGDLLVRMEKDRLNSVLTHLYRIATAAEEEGGSNILYLAIGFLIWKQRPDQERSFRAPLILIPVRLERRSVRSGFRLRLHEDDPRFNPTLLQMLRQDFDLRIPALEGELPTDEHGLDVRAIWDEVRLAVRDIQGWEVVEDVLLSTFSFAKYLMWKDLSDRLEHLKANDLVRHLIETSRDPYAGGADGDFPRPGEIDRIWHPRDVFTPLPADSSQMAAILAAARGKGFVLIGPPGTGKSQTIANMIAQCLAVGKTVLFVSEKTAALDVVYRRLKRIGLDAHCLELHSHKARKFDVVRQLGRAWEDAEEMDEAEWRQEAERLAGLQEQLNRYVEHLHRRHGNGWTAYRAIGEVVSNPEVPHVPLSWPAADAHTEEGYDRLYELACRIDRYREQVGEFHDNPLQGIAKADWSPSWQSRFLDAARALMAAAGEAEERIVQLVAALDVPPPPLDARAAEALVSLGQRVVEAHGKPWACLLGEEGTAILEELRQARDALEKYHAAWAKLSVPYQRQATELDLDALAAEWHEAAGSWWGRRVWLQHWVRAHLRKVTRDGVLPATGNVAEDIENLARARRAQGALDGLASMGRCLGGAWQGPDTSLEDVQTVLDWTEALLSGLRTLAPEAEGYFALRRRIHALLGEGNELLGKGGRIERAVQAAHTAWQRFCDQRQTMAELIEGTDESMGDPEADNYFATVQQVCRAWLEAEARLKYWCAWQTLRREALGQGLAPLVETIERDAVDISAERLFRVNYCRWWMNALLEEDEVLRTFVPTEFEALRKQYATLDEQLRELAARQVRARVCSRIPARGNNNDTHQEENAEAAASNVLRREMHRRRGHMPVRKLVTKLGDTLTRLTPCVMMSPLSIAQYLPADTRLFDVVIFDEASQIPTWDAVGAIARGKQAIIVGDPKQLPPTSFFQRGSDEEFQDDDLDVDELESILDECLGANVPVLKLNWHYRSRDESLIAFSNAQYYDGALITFPSPAAREAAVQLHPVPDGVYEKGRARTNQAEARALVDWVVAHLRDPDFQDSLGVVTFNVQQQRLIQDLLDQARHDHPEIEPYFDDERPEPVFVKNLESVQGDERDVILFSITYGPDRTGHVSVNFGPLNREGGHRRLNVAVTRARKALHVFSTLRPHQIDLRRTQAQGVEDLKLFLEYAERGPRALAEAITGSVGDFESPFEEAVAQALMEKGWVVHPQVGVSSFRIDLGIVHPEQPGRYLAGVECDGATYHRSATARDRDILRERILRNLGWEIVRVWSTDWWTDSTAAIERLDQALRRLLPDESRG